MLLEIQLCEIPPPQTDAGRPGGVPQAGAGGHLPGKCFTITTPCQVRQEEFLTIMANFERSSSSSSGGGGGGRDGSPLAFTLHHPGATLGLNANFYPGPVVTGTLRGDGMLDVKLRHLIP